MNRYPYPVLTDEGSSYKEDIVFEILYTKNTCSNEKISFEFEIKLNSLYLTELVQLEKVKVLLKAQSNIIIKTEELNIVNGKFWFELDTERLQSNDTVFFQAYIVACEEIEIQYHNEFLEIYGADFSAKIRKNDVLALSNKEKLSYSTTNHNFIKFSVSNEQEGKGFRIEPEENYIKVVAGPKLNGAYGIIKRNNQKELCAVFDSHLVFEVFVYALVIVVQNYDDYKEREWCRLFEQIFVQSSGYENMESFAIDVLDEGRIDMGQIYFIAQKMVNNQIENSLISISKVYGG